MEQHKNRKSLFVCSSGKSLSELVYFLGILQTPPFLMTMEKTSTLIGSLINGMGEDLWGMHKFTKENSRTMMLKSHYPESNDLQRGSSLSAENPPDFH